MESEIDRLRKKVENFPSPSSYNRLAELLHLAKQEVEAEAVCRKCVKEFPRNSQVYALVADIQLATGRKAEAGVSLRSALERDGRNYAAARMYADWLADNRDLPGAVAQLKQVLAFRPADPAVMRRIRRPMRSEPPGHRPVRMVLSPMPTPHSLRGIGTDSSSPPWYPRLEIVPPGRGYGGHGGFLKWRRARADASECPLKENDAADVLRRVVGRSGCGLDRVFDRLGGVLDVRPGHLLAGLGATAARFGALLHHRVALGEFVARLGALVADVHALLADVGGVV